MIRGPLSNRKIGGIHIRRRHVLVYEIESITRATVTIKWKGYAKHSVQKLESSVMMTEVFAQFCSDLGFKVVLKDDGGSDGGRSDSGIDAEVEALSISGMHARDAYPSCFREVEPTPHRHIRSSNCVRRIVSVSWTDTYTPLTFSTISSI
jgi:hypothetical protein